MTKLYLAETGAGTEATDVKHFFLQIIATFTGITYQTSRQAHLKWAKGKSLRSNPIRYWR
jgi:hypothetical protein